MPPKEPAAPKSPATDATIRDGNMSAGNVCMIVDQNWWPKSARLKKRMASFSGDLAIRRDAGMIAALIPRVILRERSMLQSRCINLLLNHPPKKLPAPANTYGIQA